MAHHFLLILFHQQYGRDNHQHMSHHHLSKVLRQQSLKHRQLPTRGLDYFAEFYNGLMNTVGCVLDGGRLYTARVELGRSYFQEGAAFLSKGGLLGLDSSVFRLNG